jgi:hypothetical protein
VLVHTISHLAVAGTIACLVYDCIGLAVFRRSWFNVDLVWSFSLLAGGALLLLTMLGAVRPSVVSTTDVGGELLAVPGSDP